MLKQKIEELMTGFENDGYKTHLALTHFLKEKGPDPGITPEGWRHGRSFGKMIPDCISCIVRGTGRRHQETLEALGLIGAEAEEDPLLGSDASLEVGDGKKLVIYKNGKIQPLEDYVGPTKEQVENFLDSLPAATLLVLGREILTRYYPEAQSGVFYLLLIKDGKFTVVPCPYQPLI